MFFNDFRAKPHYDWLSANECKWNLTKCNQIVKIVVAINIYNTYIGRIPRNVEYQ